MTESTLPPAPAAEPPVQPPRPAAPGITVPPRWIAAGLGAAALAALAAAALMMAWTTQQRVKGLEQELVRRQQDSSSAAAEAQILSKQAQDTARDSAAKLALLEARVAETSLQRTQIEELIQSLSRSRDENVLADVEAAIRVSLQQAAITGSAEPLVAALKQADERLARYSQPRLERVRRAVGHDLERVRALGVVDVSVLTIRLDEAIRQVDDLPLLSGLDRRGPLREVPRAASAPARVASAATAASAPSGSGWQARLDEIWRTVGVLVWDEVRALVRVTRIDQPEAMLVAPEQAFFLRENLKLRLLNARLALLSRQFDTAQSDLRDAQAALERYFDRSARRVAGTMELVRQVAAQARMVSLPRPDATLAAIAAATAGR